MFKSFLSHVMICCLSLTVATSVAAVPFFPSNQQSEDPVVKNYTLSNGLSLSVQPERSLPLVTLDMWVRAGGGDEPEDLAGISHFLEHMMFKGTERLEVGEYDRRIEEIGGHLNAGTSQDYTHYYVSIPSEHFDRVLTDFADVLSNSLIDPQEVERERLVVQEEIRRKEDDPFGFLYDNSASILFNSGPYQIPVIGTMESVAAITRTQLHEHYKRFYTADNMYLSIAGDVDPEEVREKVDVAFQGLDTKMNPWMGEWPETRYAEPTRKIFPRDWQETYFIVAFPGPGSEGGMKAMAVSEYVEGILSGGRSSRLVKSLVEEKALASSVSVYIPVNRSPAAVMIFGTCEPDKAEEVRTEIFNELDRLVSEGPTGKEMKRVQQQKLNSHLFSLETNSGRASNMGYSNLMFRDTRIMDKYDDELKDVSTKDVRKFIEEWLRVDRSSFILTTTAEK